MSVNGDRYSVTVDNRTSLLDLLREQLLAKSPDFADLWQRYEVQPYSAAAKTLNDPEVGTFTLNVQSMRIEGTPGHRLVIYHAEPGTPDHDAMVLLDQIAHARTPRHS